jgi:ribose-phosphate pyrophosphokinase
MIEAIGIDEVITVDVHNPAAFENAFRCQTHNLSPAQLFVEHFRGLATESDRLVVVSPDAGGVMRARRFASCLTDATGRLVDVAFVEKHRSGGVVSGAMFAGEVRDATIIIIDDMISGGTTMHRAAEFCMERGAQVIHAAATHGIFASHAAEAFGAGLFESVVVTDSVPDVRERGQPFTSRLAVLGLASQLAAAIG